MDDRDRKLELYKPDSRDFTQISEYAGMVDELTEKMTRQVEEGRVLIERDWGTAIAAAVNLRAAVGLTTGAAGAALLVFTTGGATTAAGGPTTGEVVDWTTGAVVAAG